MTHLYRGERVERMATEDKSLEVVLTASWEVLRFTLDL